MKYDELLKILRECNDCICEEHCPYYEERNNPIRCMTKIVGAAADAIDELQSQLPKWIPVSERLPMPHTKVLLAYKQGVTIGYLGGYPKKGEKAYFHGMHGWKHTLSSITHWQYPPEPPKEETDG